MLQVQGFIRLLIAALLLSFAGGAAMAELGCAAPVAVASSMPADCPASTSGDGSVLACQPMCIAVQETADMIPEPPRYSETQIALVPVALPTRHIGPEPPPPRAG